MMYNPFWLLHAAQELNVDPNFDMWPEQYRWAVGRRSDIINLKNVMRIINLNLCKWHIFSIYLICLI